MMSLESVADAINIQEGLTGSMEQRVTSHPTPYEQFETQNTQIAESIESLKKSHPSLEKNSKRSKHNSKEAKSPVNQDVDRKREVRLMKNRQSAALSRQRKKEFIGNLQKQLSRLSQENGTYQAQISKLTNQNWENKLCIERLEKEILKLINENGELRSRLKGLGQHVEEKKHELPDLPSMHAPSDLIAPDSTHLPGHLSLDKFGDV